MQQQSGDRGVAAWKRVGLLAAIVFAAAAAVLGIGAYVAEPPVGLAAVALQAALIALLVVPAVELLGHRGTTARHQPAAADQAEALPDWPTIDAVSRTLNERGITVGLLELMALANRYGHRLAVALFEIDHLEDVLRQFGRAAADSVVRKVAETMGDLVRMPDRIGRCDEARFLLLLPETDAAGAKLIAERVREAVAGAELAVTARKRLQLTVSVGVTEHRSGEDMDMLLTRVGDALEQAKKQGHNRVVAQPSGYNVDNVTLH